MFLSRFRVRGYKCLEDVDIALTPIHVLIGPSDSGKSSLLEAISAFYGRLKTPATRWFPAAASPRDLVTHGSSVPAIDLAGHWSEVLPDGSLWPVAGYGYSILPPASGTHFAITDQWVRPRAGEDLRSGLARVAIAYPHGGSPVNTEDRIALATFRDSVQKMLEPAPVYRLEPQRLAEPASVDPSRPCLLASNGHGLPMLLDTIAQRHPERIAEIQAEFCRMLPQYKSLGFQSVALETKNKSSRARLPESQEAAARGLFLESCSGRKMAASDISPGAMLLLTMLTLARLPEPPRLLLIEDIERGLYPQWLGDVIMPLRHAVSQPDGRPFAQVILSTHSPAVLNLFQPEEVTLLSRPADKPDGPMIARPLASMKKIVEKLADGETRLGELWSEF